MTDNETLEAIHELGTRLSNDPHSDHLAQECVEILERSMGYELLAVLTVTEPGAGLRPIALSKQGRDLAFVDSDKRYVESRCSDQAAGLTGWVAQTGRTVRVGVVQDDGRYYGIRDNIQSELCVPLCVGGKVTGVLNTETTTPNSYSVTDELFLETAASHIALALEYHRKHRSELLREQLGKAGSRIHTICSYCKNVRVEKDNWCEVESFFLYHYGAVFSHGVCPSCLKRASELDL